MCRPKIIVTFSSQGHCRGRFKIGGRPAIARFAAQIAAQIATAEVAAGGTILAATRGSSVAFPGTGDANAAARVYDEAYILGWKKQELYHTELSAKSEAGYSDKVVTQTDKLILFIRWQGGF